MICVVDWVLGNISSGCLLLEVLLFEFSHSIGQFVIIFILHNVLRNLVNVLKSLKYTIWIRINDMYFIPLFWIVRSQKFNIVDHIGDKITLFILDDELTYLSLSTNYTKLGSLPYLFSTYSLILPIVCVKSNLTSYIFAVEILWVMFSLIVVSCAIGSANIWLIILII